MRTVLVIGIGMGDPDQLTVQAITALNAVDVFFVVDKGEASRELVDLRTSICERVIQNSEYRMVEIADIDRDRADPDYRGAVVDWHEQRAALYAEVIAAELPDDGVGGLLVWGDPCLYDSTIRIVETISSRNLEFRYRVIPGISSVQALAAGHRLVLNGIGEPVLITTGRRLAQAVATGAENIVVMLDGSLACRQLLNDDSLATAKRFEIFWGAYLGTADEVLISGSLADVVDEISDVRADLKQRKGWIMDTYLLRNRAL